MDWNDDDEQVFSIVGCSNDAVINARPRPERLTKVKLPPNVEYIGFNAFRGSINLRSVEFKNRSKLKTIAANAFSSASLQELDLSGCTSLKEIKNQAFSSAFGWSLKGVDFSETALSSIGEKVFSNNGPKVQYIEFPITFRESGSYQWGAVSNILYIRHRSLVSPVYGWDNWNYYNGAMSGAGANGTHMFEIDDDKYGSKNDKTFPMFIPNVVTMRKSYGTFWMADDDGYRLASMSVPLGKPVTDPNWKPSSDPDFNDTLRGQDLLDAQELYRGVTQLKLNASGLTGVDGKEVTAHFNGTASATKATVAAGGFTLTIGAPPDSDLKEMTPYNFQEVTIPYSDVRNKNSQSPQASDVWRFGGSGGNRSGIYGLPHIANTPSNGQPGAEITTYEQFYAVDTWKHTNPAKYAVLKLVVDGKEALNQTSDVREVETSGGVYSEQRTVTYVYVKTDAPILVHRMMRRNAELVHTLHTVELQLKNGWNFIETRTTTPSSRDAAAPAFLPTDRGNTSIWISGGIIGDNPSSVLNAHTQFRIDSKPIGWVVK
jgi:hypothetical protein